ncbi:DUF3429 domain-containing protein [Vibrio maerlii]|uniref:DUF3429 domain-containing protein n=1 Tax=Vibrio maerlii TaxID=2231648 RepID=UPI000E3BE44B|nr:DUF3429 domain-containing protein [Vibrio maerlii]
MSPTNKTMLSLGYLGLVPFSVGLILTISNIELLNLNGATVFTTYSAVILSFLSGVLWGSGIASKQNDAVQNLLIVSNVFALVAWLVLLIDSNNFYLATMLLTAGYLSIWFIERHNMSESRKEERSFYLTMRSKLTSFVVFMHVLALIFK